MNMPIVSSEKPVVLVGGAIGPDDVLLSLLADASCVVAADSGANWLHRVGHIPDAVIGDMDSISAEARAAIGANRINLIAEQDSTDFDKCLRNIEAPLITCIGFLGARVDHMLAALTVMARYPQKKCVLIGDHDVMAHLPPGLSLKLPVGSRLSLFPMVPVTGQSRGLEWPIKGLDFAPHTRVGTSNRVTGDVELTMHNPGMLVILPVSQLSHLTQALLQSGDSWPAP